MNRIVVLGAVVCVASLAFAQKVRVDFDHGIHFTSYKTYSWTPSADAPPQEALFPNQLMRERIVGFIEEALAAKGLKRVATGGDILLSYGMKIQEQPEYLTFSDGDPGWGWGWGSSFSTTTVQTFYEGTLVVGIVDANQKKLVFQGTSTQSISSKPEKNTKKMAKAVIEIFEKYPPRP